MADENEDRVPGRKINDPELVAMHDIIQVLNGLDDDHAKQRVIAWAACRAGLVLAVPTAS